MVVNLLFTDTIVELNVGRVVVEDFFGVEVTTGQVVVVDDYDLSSRYFDTEEIFDYDPANIEFDYRVREKQIDDHDITYGKQMSNSLGASIYPSMWVKTHLLGNEYWGQIIEMPDTFPEGKYTVRMLVTRDGQDMEVVYVQRTVYEMEWEFNSESSNQSTSLLPTYY